MQDGSIKVLSEDRLDTPKSFNKVILGSELLSRGWVYQEVLLTPANLFCTKEQLWWSCSDSTCSESWPKNIPHFYSIRQDSIYEDKIRKQKSLIIGTNKDFPWRLWGEVLQTYGRTKVTVPDDRVVGLTGVSNVLRSLAPQLENAVYHSGVWSGSHILQQIMWTNGIYNKCFDRVDTARYPIPSWSPLCSKKPYQFFELDALPLPPLGDVSIKNEGLDTLGRATSLEGCAIHLRGILVPIEILVHDRPTSECIMSSYSKGYIVAHLRWDGEKLFEDVKSAMEEEEQGEGQGSCNLQALFLFSRGPNFEGLALRPCDNGLRQIDGRRVWSRCGHIEMYLNRKRPEKVTEYIEASPLGAYGFTWIRENPEEEDEWNRKWQRQPSGVTPQLEDICIV